MDMAASDPMDQPTMWALKMCRWSIRWMTSSAISSMRISSLSYSVIPTPRLSMVMTLYPFSRGTMPFQKRWLAPMPPMRMTGSPSPSSS